MGEIRAASRLLCKRTRCDPLFAGVDIVCGRGHRLRAWTSFATVETVHRAENAPLGRTLSQSPPWVAELLNCKPVFGL